MISYQENNMGLKILTPTGYMDFSGISDMGIKDIWRTEFDGDLFIETTDDHKVYINEEETKPVSDLRVGDLVETSMGKKRILNIQFTGRSETVYDIIDVDGGHKFYANGILVSNCEFVSGDDTLISPLTLNNLTPRTEIYTINEHVRIFEEPQPNHIYGVGWDPAMGNEGDYASIQVLDFTTMNQMAEWKSNKVPVEFQLTVLATILYYINETLYDDPRQEGEPEIYWTVENNGLGLAADSEIKHLGEENLPGILISEPKSKIKGLRTNSTNKLATCSLLKKLLEKDRLTVFSRPLIKELKNFVRGGGSYKAKPGEHDDLVMSLILVIRIFSIISEWDDNLGEDMESNILEDMIIEPMPVIF